MVRLDWRDGLRALPSQTPWLLECLGLTRADADAAVWAVLPDGTLRSRADAIYTGFDQLVPGGAPLFSALGGLPLKRQASDALYRLVARYRHLLPGTATCSLGPPAKLSRNDTEELARRLGPRETR